MKLIYKEVILLKQVRIHVGSIIKIGVDIRSDYTIEEYKDIGLLVTKDGMTDLILWNNVSYCVVEQVDENAVVEQPTLPTPVEPVKRGRKLKIQKIKKEEVKAPPAKVMYGLLK